MIRTWVAVPFPPIIRPVMLTVVSKPLVGASGAPMAPKASVRQTEASSGAAALGVDGHVGISTTR